MTAAIQNLLTLHKQAAPPLPVLTSHYFYHRGRLNGVGLLQATQQVAEDCLQLTSCSWSKVMQSNTWLQNLTTGPRNMQNQAVFNPKPLEFLIPKTFRVFH